MTLRALGVLLLTMVCCVAQAQVRFGNRAGAAWLKQAFQPTVDHPDQKLLDRKMDGMGFTGAITLELPLAGIWMLNVEAVYAERGYGRSEKRTKGIPGGLTFGDRIRTRHAGLCVLPKARIGNKAVMVEIFGGVELSRVFAFSDQHREGVYIWEADKIFTVYPPPYRADLLAPWQLSAVGGAGLAFRVGRALLHLNGRYIRGLSNVYDMDVAFTDVNGYPFGTGKVYERSVALTLGYSLPLSAPATKTPLE